MYKLILFILLVPLCSCGGGSSSNSLVFDGVWRGNVFLDLDCEIIGPPTDEVVGHTWEITIATQDDTDGFGYRDISIVDDFGNVYSGDIVGEQAIAHNDVLFELGQSDGILETGVSNIKVSNLTSTSIDVQFVNFGGSRFCSDVFLGVFEKVG